MSSPQTEAYHAQGAGLDARPDAAVLSTLLAGQRQAIDALEPALPALAQGAALMVRAMREGGRLVYAAAGSSGLMALADAAELGGTFGIDPARVAILMAGGLPVDAEMPGRTEDDAAAAERAARGIAENDTVIALSASGRTAFPLTVAQIARRVGARVVAIANNPGAPLFGPADVAICLPTPPEVIAGSTRLGAGTAQKAALNLMSTLMGIRLGHVHDGLMVNLVADNAKLRGRALGIVQRIAGADEARARASLANARGAVKPAVLIAAGAENLRRAEEMLNQDDGNLRAALARLSRRR